MIANVREVSTTTEPFATAALLAAFGALLALSAFFSRISQRIAVPVALMFLAIGMVAGSEGIFGIPFEDYGFAFRLGTIALVLILFEGGLHTPMEAIRTAAKPAALLATAGVIGTAGLTAVVAHALGFAWPHAMLLGAIVSSTDAAAVFAVLRGSGIQLKKRVGATLELESGFNDPMAVILTVAMTEFVIAPERAIGLDLAIDVVREIAIGGVAGVIVARAGLWVLARVRLASGALYPTVTLGVAFLAFAVPTLLHGSGFLAVYVAGVVLGSGALPYRAGLFRVHDALGWLSQITMFLVLGLLAFPSRLVTVAGIGLLIALFVSVVARPLVVALCLLPFRGYTKAEIGYVGWVGLRGAVPIILATYPVLAGAPGASRVFDVVFFIVVVNAIIPSATVPWVTRKLGLQSSEPPPPAAVLEIQSMQPLSGELVSFHIDDAVAAAGVPLRDVPFPASSSAVLVVRGNTLIPPRGRTVLIPGDHVYIATTEEDRPLLHLLFGGAESDTE